MKNDKYTLLMLFFLLITFPKLLYSQNPEWVSYSNGDQITSLVSDSSNLWIGTYYGGLVKFNLKTSSKTFYNKSNSKLSNNCVSALAIDRNGYLWIGTAGSGILKFDGLNWEIIQNDSYYNSYITDNSITSLVIDSLNNVWWSSFDAGIKMYNGKTITRFDPSNSEVPTHFVRSLAVDSSNNIWAATREGVGKLDGKKWIEIADIDMWIIIAGRNSKIYMGGPYGGLFIYDGKQLISNKQGILNYQFNALSLDKEGNVWIGTGLGLVKFNGHILAVYDSTNSNLIKKEIYSINIDYMGNFWIGTHNSLNKFDNSSWEEFETTNSGMPNNDVEAIAIDKNNIKWIGTRNGLAMFDFKNWNTFSTDNSRLSSSSINCIAIDNENNKWISSGALIKFDGKSWYSFSDPFSGNKIAEVYSIVSENKTMWLGTNKGLIKYDGYSWNHYYKKDLDIESNYIYILSIAIDSNGNKWLGTWAYGMIKYDGEKFIKFNKNNSGLPDSTINSIAIGINDDVWIGTNKGLVRYNGDKWTKYNDNEVSSIAVDKNGDVWAGYNGSGISKYSSDSDTLIYFTSKNSGLPSNYVTSIAIDSSGNKWIGMYKSALAVYKKGGIVFIKNENYSTTQTCSTLYQNFPNPFNESTIIHFELFKNTKVKLSLFNMLGEEIRVLIDNKNMDIGIYKFNLNSYELEPGVYFYVLKTNDCSIMKKMIVNN